MVHRVLNAFIHPAMLIRAISIHFCMALSSSSSSRSPSRVDQAPAVSGGEEEGDRSVKSDLLLAIPRGVYTG